MATSENAQIVAQNLINLFESGNAPQALAKVALNAQGNRPSAKWSISNQILQAIAETEDARGFNQWKEVGRSVKKGSKAFFILAPNTARVKKEEDGEEVEVTVATGYRCVPVFRYEDTEGEALPEDNQREEYLASVPEVLSNTARAWGIKVQLYDASKATGKGYYERTPFGREIIGIGVEDITTFAHELIHASDHRLLEGGLPTEQDPDSEIVAQFGASVLMHLLGHGDKANDGYTKLYIEHYSESGKAISNVIRLLNRINNAVSLILNTAQEGAFSKAA